MDDARRAKLDRKPNYVAYPRQMLSARASAELVRAMFADVIGGLSAIEEVDDLEPIVLLDPPETVAPTTRTRRRRGAAAAVAPVELPPEPRPVVDVELPPLPGEEPPVQLCTQPQQNRMHKLYRERGITARSGSRSRSR